MNLYVKYFSLLLFCCIINSVTLTRLSAQASPVNLISNGIYKVDKFTKVNFSFNHQNELIKLAFINNTVEAGISKQFADRLVLGSNISYNSYDDKVSDNKSFGLLRAKVDAVFTPARKASVFGNVTFQSKNFKGSVDNNYQAVLYTFGANLIPNSKKNIRFQIQGNKQFSEKDKLNFNQISPQIIYTLKKSQEKSFNLGLDCDLLKFAETNNFNDYQNFSANFRWQNNINKKGLSRNLSVTYKQYPNNSKKGYYMLGFIMEKRTGSVKDEKSSVSSFSSIINIMAQRENNILKDYLDLHWDRSKIRPKCYSNMNILTRLWNNYEMITGDISSLPDHFIDFFSEFGPYYRNITDGDVKIICLKIGFVVGGHLLFNFDEESFIRNGNSVRGGFAVSGNIKILKASLVLTGSYERSLIICIENGDNLFRKPSSFKFNFDYRQPIKNNWDMHFNLSTYDLRTVATSETRINPIVKKSSLCFSGGLVYRIVL